ncbi:MAG: tautomerase family protein [Candidatus Bathyarchaeota archaeon]|nr:tautomerase family protein [Candidatus Bathyarchaeota archaeon]
MRRTKRHKFKIELTFSKVSHVPVVIVEWWKGRTVEQKEKLVKGITRAFEEVGVPPEHLNIIIHDIPKTNWGTSGKLSSKTAP